MKNKEKRINEMSRDMCFVNSCNTKSCYVVNCETTWLAEKLIDLNYQKVSEDSIVLTKAEKQKLLHEMYEQGRFDALADLEKEGKVVMSKEEYKIWFKKDGYFLGYRDGENSAVNYYETLALPSKEMETAERFYNKVNENICVFKLENKSQEFTDGYIQAIADICGILDQVAKQFDIEIEENNK